MSKIIQALLAGSLFTFICDFFLFLGIKLHYIDAYNIEVYYNILFADNQNFIIYTILSFFFGYVIIYINHKISIPLTLVFALFTLSALIPIVGHAIGESLLMQKNVQLHDQHHTYVGDIYYNGRKTITFYDNEIKKVIILQKNKLKEYQ